MPFLLGVFACIEFPHMDVGGEGCSLEVNEEAVELRRRLRELGSEMKSKVAAVAALEVSALAAF